MTTIPGDIKGRKKKIIMYTEAEHALSETRECLYKLGKIIRKLEDEKVNLEIEIQILKEKEAREPKDGDIVG